MKIPRYWAKGAPVAKLGTIHPATGREVQEFSCWGWSDLNLEEAKRRGRERAELIVSIIREGRKPQAYLYGDLPIREEVVDEWRQDDLIHAATTINSYGCLVLNVADVMFVDVDLPEESGLRGLKTVFKGLLGKPSGDERVEREAPALQRLEQLVLRDPSVGVRVYRTRAGLRYLMTNGVADPLSEDSTATMKELGADPLYVRLCKAQECYRARLTPKPWRCGARSVKMNYPWVDAAARAEAEEWMQGYRRKADRYATCEFLRQLGSTDQAEGIGGIVALHDKMTRADSGLSLA